MMKIVVSAAWYLVPGSRQKQTFSDSRLLKETQKIKREKGLGFQQHFEKHTVQISDFIILSDIGNFLKVLNDTEVQSLLKMEINVHRGAFENFTLS